MCSSDLKVMKVNDLDISGAKDLKDLYDCRVCANHIAQVYLRGIMDAGNLALQGEVYFFDPESIDNDETVLEQLRRAAEIV